ncbi:putative sexual differentiation process protein isp4 [Phaeomoniella chlamydospora]|uniref:Putative sexual differentiation process protein isp4 n=1 Tax=Phaeomoniella chlamydospora TaxID=158046 RepID=A0A0G2HF23_PHACM|nr:putative sexual differentiation process protein isp4 [Phaeomoniella chlamydospora]
MAGQYNHQQNASYHESIPLTQRPAPLQPTAVESDDELFPDSDAAYLRRHRSLSVSDADEFASSEIVSSTPGLLARLRAFVMSRNPLLMRSSPALGTGSYGAVPVQSSSPNLYSSSDEDEEANGSSRDRGGMGRASSATLRQAKSAATLRKTMSATQGTRRRASSSASDIVMGPQGKSSFAGGGSIPGRHVMDGIGESSNATTDESEEEDYGKDNVADPPDNSPYPETLGYAFAGLTRRYLVRPAAMIWPGTLMSTAMFTAMHRQENKIADGWRISRYQFFVVVWACAFVWYFLPGLLIPALSYFNVVTWFAPKNVVVANLFGVTSGLGLFPLTFDWAQIAYIGSPLLTPWWAAANVVGGLVLVMWIVAPVMYYMNVLHSSYFPIVSWLVFDNEAKQYDVNKILTKDFVFDKLAYEAYSRVYLPITYVLSYAVQFASLSALITHTVCWHGKDILRQTKIALGERQGKDAKADYQAVPNGQQHRPVHSVESETGMGDMMGTQEDVHCRLMRRYEDAPMMWYLTTFVIMLAIGIFVVEYYPTHLPWYGLLLALSITTILFIPVGIVMAITNQHSSLYLICQLICGAVFPGRPVANMVFVTYCYISSAQGIKFSSDLKLGHYMKIPPKTLFMVQMVATLISSFTQIGVLNWMFINIPGICTAEAINGFNCPIARVHFNGSILWGVVGPQRFFGPGALYRPLVWAFLVGAIAPICVWLMGRQQKKSVWQKINFPVLFGSLSWIPPATGINFSVWAIVCFCFNHILRRRASAWWGKYTMTLSAALDSGLAFALVVVFFGFVYPGVTKDFKWWGTEIYKQGCDWQACAYKTLAPGEKFDQI